MQKSTIWLQLLMRHIQDGGPVTLVAQELPPQPSEPKPGIISTGVRALDRMLEKCTTY